MLKDYMQKLQESTGSDFSTSEIGVYRIPINENLFILAQERNRRLILESILGEPPTRNEDEFYSNALQGNLYGQSTAGAILSQTPEGRFIKISYEGQDPPNFNRFRQIIEDFWDVAVVWQEELQTANSQR
jgi:hypothetical protein